MKTLFAALVATAAFTGVAAAEGSPQLIGNYSVNVLEEHNGTSSRPVAQSNANGADVTSRAAIRAPRTRVQGGYGPGVGGSEHFGR